VGGKTEPVTETPRGHGSGKAGLAILRNAGIDVDIMGASDVEGQATTEQKRILDKRNDTLQKALADVDKQLDIKKS